MKEYVVKRMTGAKPKWSDVEPLMIDIPYLNTKDNVTAEAKLCYNDEAIYVYLSTTEPETRSKETGPLCEPCLDSCLEFFFSPMEGDKRYFNIEFNSRGAYYFGIGSSLKNLVRLLPEGNPGIFGARVRRRNDGWSITYRVPAELVARFFPEFRLESGKRMRANCYKCSDAAKEPNYLSWSEVTGKRLSFHRPDDFGTFILE